KAPLYSRSLTKYALKLKARGHKDRNITPIASRYLRARSANSPLDTSYYSDLEDIDFSTDPSVLFSSEATYILGPEFQITFPGYYTGRVTYIHVLTHPASETKVLLNSTISGLYKTHSSYIS
ncbi:Intradiol ring-cleavage dioxygenase core, partial [Penicillium paradoxum]|uniref:Intradiol ring-cleavage dioxygenase core n=1 Tax=Penicillium paradoxum TaxID=176176 RepID=UPI0025477309